MKELFKQAMVVCSAIASFSGGTYIVASGLGSIADSRLQAYADKAAAVAKTADAVDATESSEAVLQSLKKLGKGLLK